MATVDDLFLVSYLFMKGLKPKITCDGRGGRVYFDYPETPEFDQGIRDFDQNVNIGILDFKIAWRTMRNEMMSAKDRKDLLTRRRINYGDRS